jgi:HEAT repeat protein
MSSLALAFDFPPWRQSFTSSPRPASRHVESRSVEDLVRRLVLAASEMAWSGDRNRSLAARDALIRGGSLSVPIVLHAVTSLPRADVQEEAIGILRTIVEQGAVSELLALATKRDEAPAARATAARALGVASLAPQAAQDAVRALVAMLWDASTEVRDAAVAGLSDRGGVEAKHALEAALGSETVDFIRAAIREAIEEC